MSGSLDEKSKPWHSLNYIESHDDYAFVDRICKNEDRSLKSVSSSFNEQTKLALFNIILTGRSNDLRWTGFHATQNGMKYLPKGRPKCLERYEDCEKYQGLSTEIQKMISFRLSDRGAFLRPQNGSDVTYQ